MSNFMDKLSGAFTEMSDKVSGVVEEVNPVENLSAKEKKTMVQKLDITTFGILAVAAVAAPLVIFPLASDWFDGPKQAVILAGAILGILSWAIKAFFGQKLNLARSAFDLPIVLFVAIFCASALLSPNRIMAITADPSMLLGAAGLFFLAGIVLDSEKRIVNFTKFILGSGAVLAIWSVIQIAFNFIAPVLKLKIDFLPLSAGFSLAGSTMTQAMILAVLLPLGFGAYKTVRGMERRIFQGLMAVVGVGLVTSLFTLYQGKPILLPFEMGWKIAAGVMAQSFQAALLGVGAGNFIDAFTAFKPVDINATSLWNLRFTTSSNYYFYVLAVSGIGGLAAILFLVYRFLLAAKKRMRNNGLGLLEKGLITSLGLIVLGMAVLPTPMLLVFYLFLFLGVFVALSRINRVESIAWEDEKTLSESAAKLIFAVVFVAILGVPGYFLGRNLVADYFFNQSLVAARANRGADTYNFQIRAIGLNPDNDMYHANYAQTNLLLADNLASQKDLTDEQKQTVVTLVQQAIREGRAAVALAPNRVGNYETLSMIYRNLINFAQGADQWAITAQQQAVNLEPVNPRLRLDLGGIYLSFKDYASAGQVFAQAVNLKADYANAHYNLAQAMKELKMKEQAGQQLQLTATLVCQANPNGDDCKKVNAEITELGVNAATASAQPEVKKEETTLATPGAQVNPNLPKAKVSPAPKISSPSGEVTR